MAKKLKHIVRFPDIVDDAKRLRVSREHLWRVLSGRRRSRKLMEEYNELQILKKSQDVPVPAKDAPKNRVYVIVQGGVVQDVLADNRNLVAYLIDYDNGACDEKWKADNQRMEDECAGLPSIGPK